MKIKNILLVIACSFIVLSSCSYKSYTVNGKIPPGQAKKIAGEKSAKKYAPGQRKKS